MLNQFIIVGQYIDHTITQPDSAILQLRQINNTVPIDLQIYYLPDTYSDIKNITFGDTIAIKGRINIVSKTEICLVAEKTSFVSYAQNNL